MRFCYLNHRRLGNRPARKTEPRPDLVRRFLHYSITQTLPDVLLSLTLGGTPTLPEPRLLLASSVNLAFGNSQRTRKSFKRRCCCATLGNSPSPDRLPQLDWHIYDYKSKILFTERKEKVPDLSKECKEGFPHLDCFQNKVIDQ